MRLPARSAHCGADLRDRGARVRGARDVPANNDDLRRVRNQKAHPVRYNASGDREPRAGERAAQLRELAHGIRPRCLHIEGRVAAEVVRAGRRDSESPFHGLGNGNQIRHDLAPRFLRRVAGALHRDVLRGRKDCHDVGSGIECDESLFLARVHDLEVRQDAKARELLLQRADGGRSLAKHEWRSDFRDVDQVGRHGQHGARGGKGFGVQGKLQLHGVHGILCFVVELEVLTLESSLAEALNRPPRAPHAVGLHWLGQAGFAVQGSGQLLFIDPYLSDSLARKYQGKEFPHLRMMPTPIAPRETRGLTAVLCTHRHGDHMDPGTLPLLARGNPSCLFVVPRAEKERALEIGIPEPRLRTMDAGETLPLLKGIQVDAIAAAHEDLARNDRGELLHLGYIVTVSGLRIYHSGDCVPYEGLEETVRASAIDVALLPVNGRSRRLSSRGILGNFSLDEAVGLCRAAGIRFLFCHHWGMFDFNTIDPRAVEQKIAQLGVGIRCVMPRVGVRYLLEKK